MPTTYAMAMKHSAASHAPAGWLDRLTSIQGVQVLGHTEHGAEFTATPAAIAQVRTAFSGNFIIEEVHRRDIT
jgi:hypothetical protein